MAEKRSFLVVNVSRIGDTLLATPALQAIAQHDPDAEITVLAHPKRWQILQHLPYIKCAGGISKKGAPLRGWLPGKQYDVAIVYGFDQALVRYALRVADKVVAFRQRDDGLNKRLYRVVETPAFQSEHSVQQLLRLPAALDIAPVGLRLQYQVTNTECDWAQQRLQRDVPADAKWVVGIQAASFPTKAYRDWPVEHFATLANKMTAELGKVHFLIFGGSAEKQRTAWLANQLAGQATLYAGQLSLRETAALMSQLHLYVGVDTGPTHIMSAFDIPLVGLYHCFSPSRLIGPLQHPYFHAVDHPRPYGCPIETPMSEISVETVFERIRYALAGQSSLSATS